MGPVADMVTPESWYRAAEEVLERENGRIPRKTAKNADIRPKTLGFAIEGLYGPDSPDSDGVIDDFHLLGVSLVRNPLNPHARVISVSTPRGSNDLVDIINAKGVDDDWRDDELVKT